MTCDELAQLLGDYIDGTLEAEIHATVELHAGGCTKCGRHVDTYRLTVRVVRALPKREPLSAECEQRLRTILAEQLR